MVVDEKPIAKLHLKKGLMEMNSDDGKRRRVGTFVPRGDMEFDLTNGFVRSAKLTGDITFQEVSTDHLLFESRFRTEPKLHLTYSCEMK